MTNGAGARPGLHPNVRRCRLAIAESRAFPVPGLPAWAGSPPPNPDSRPLAAVCRFGSFLVPCPSSLRAALIVAYSAPACRRQVLHSTLRTCLPAGRLRTRNSFSRLSLRPQVSPGFRFPVSGSPFPAFGSYQQRRMAMRPCKNHQIRVKIGQKGDVFRQKGIKKARISSCPS